MAEKPEKTEKTDSEHLKSISDKLTWGVIFLFIIMLSTCSLNDDIEDALRDRSSAAPAPAAADASAPAATPPSQG